MGYGMEDVFEELLGELINGNIGDLSGYMSEYLLEIFSEIIQAAAGVVLLFSLPLLALGIVYCFFGIRTYKVLLLIDSILIGGLTGACILALVILLNGGTVSGVLLGLGFGFVFFAIIFGILAWFCPKVMLAVHSFGVGFVQVTTMFQIMGLGLIASYVLGMIFGIALVVVVILYAKWTIVGTHAFKGGFMISEVVAVAVLAMSGNLSAVPVSFWISLIIFIAAGFFVQYMYVKNNLVMIDLNKPEVRPANQPVYQQPVNSAVYQPQPTVSSCRLIGLEGMYKGFEFDIEKTITFGRDVDKCNVVFPDGTKGVSRIQCQISLNEQTGAAYIVDQFSSYGTSVNGIQLEHGTEMYLNTGDVIMFGESNVFKIQY